MAQPPTRPLPRRLVHPPAVEVVFELWFVPSRSNVVGILPGMIFTQLGGQYTRTEMLPAASLPPQLRQSDPALSHAAQIRLMADDGSGISVGDQVVGLLIGTPYPGWDSLRTRIDDLVKVVGTSSLVKKIDRVSLKYVNALDVPPGDRLSALNVKVEVNGHSAPE